MNNDKLEVSRELADRLIKGDASKGANAPQLIDAWKAMDELRALLAAPIVEHQPVYQDRYGGGWINIDLGFYELCLSEPEEHELRILYTAPPELSELQATIARLTAENERMKGGQGESVAFLTIAERIRAATIADSVQEGVNIAEGRFGSAMASLCRELDDRHQGDPVAICRLWNEGGSGERTSVEWIKGPCADGAFLYTEQPAPVAVVLPDRKCDRKLGQALMENYRSGWNACLDEVTRLNTK